MLPVWPLPVGCYQFSRYQFDRYQFGCYQFGRYQFGRDQFGCYQFAASSPASGPTRFDFSLAEPLTMPIFRHHQPGPTPNAGDFFTDWTPRGPGDGRVSAPSDWH